MQKRSCCRHSTAWRKRRHGDRVKERKARTRAGSFRRALILEKVLPEVQDDRSLSALEEYLLQKLPQDTIEIGWEVSGKPGAFLFLSRRAHLLTTC